MKHKLFLLLFILSFTALSAQSAEGGVGWITKFGLAGGVNPVYLKPDLGPVNNMMPQLGLDKFSESGMFGLGGSGYVYILLFDNFRLGGIGFGASTAVDGKTGGYDREAEYSIGIGGLTAEYTLPFESVAVSVGAIIGAGSVSIDLYQNRETLSWEDFWDIGNNTSEHAQLKDTFYTFVPTINIDYPLTRYFALRIGTGYIFTFDNEWRLNNNQQILNIPSGLNGNSFFVQAGAYLGFFAF